MEKYISGHTGKVWYMTEGEALHTARHNKFKKKMNIYRCTVEGINHWHITSMSRKRSRNAARRFRNRYMASDLHNWRRELLSESEAV